MRKDLEGQSKELREGQHEGSSVLQRGIEPATIRTTRLTFKFCIICCRELLCIGECILPEACQ